MIPLWLLCLIYITYTLKLCLADSIVMNKAIFDSSTQTGIWFVEHFSPYCRICVDFAPTWKEITEEKSGLAQTHNIQFGTVDCSIHGDLCEEHGISGYPTMNLYVDGKFEQEYIGTRSKESIKSYLMRQYAKRTENSTFGDGIPTTSTTNDQKQAPLPPDNNLSNWIKKPNPKGRSIAFNGRLLKQAIERQNRPYFVKFYAPWCPHCQRLAPLWNQLAKEMKNRIDMADVNCEKFKDVCYQHNINAFPTLKLFNNGQVHVFEAATPSVSNMKTFIKEAMKKHSHNVQTITGSQLQQILNPYNSAVIYLHKDETDAGDSFMQAIKSQYGDNDLPFYQSTDMELIQRYGLEQTHLPLVMTVKDGHHSVYPGTHPFDSPLMDFEDLIKWIRSKKTPLLTQLNPTNTNNLLHDQKTVVIGIFGTNDKDSLTQFRLLAKEGTRDGDTTLFAHMDKPAFDEMTRQKYTIQKDPAIIIVDGKIKRYFDVDLDHNILDLNNTRAILQTVDSILAGNHYENILVQESYYRSNVYWLMPVGFVFLGVLGVKVASSQRKQPPSLFNAAHKD